MSDRAEVKDDYAEAWAFEINNVHFSPFHLNSDGSISPANLDFTNQ